MKNEFYGIDFSNVCCQRQAPIHAMPSRPAPSCPMTQTPSVCQLPPEQPMVVGMAYVLMQPFDTIYEPMQALNQGTLFPDLDKPFRPGGMCHG